MSRQIKAWELTAATQLGEAETIEIRGVLPGGREVNFHVGVNPDDPEVMDAEEFRRVVAISVRAYIRTKLRRIEKANKEAREALTGWNR